MRHGGIKGFEVKIGRDGGISEPGTGPSVRVLLLTNLLRLQSFITNCNRAVQPTVGSVTVCYHQS